MWHSLPVRLLLQADLITMSPPTTAALMPASATVALALMGDDVMLQLSCISGREHAYTKRMLVVV
jgi:hypothetical protein